MEKSAGSSSNSLLDDEDYRKALSVINTLQRQLVEKEEEISGLHCQIQNGFKLGREFEREKLGRGQARLEDRLELHHLLPAPVFVFPEDVAVEDKSAEEKLVEQERSVEDVLEEALEVLISNPDEEYYCPITDRTYSYSK